MIALLWMESTVFRRFWVEKKRKGFAALMEFIEFVGLIGFVGERTERIECGA